MICQALEDAKYCVSNETIREMFADLIASTMDKETCDSVHPSFSTTLKQMSSNDAKLFKIFQGNVKKPICNFSLNNNIGGFEILFENVFFISQDTSLNEAKKNALSLSVLEKLGLIHIVFSPFLAIKELYAPYEHSELLYYYRKKYENEQEKVTLQRGYVELTYLGDSLLNICCPTSCAGKVIGTV